MQNIQYSLSGPLQKNLDPCSRFKKKTKEEKETEEQVNQMKWESFNWILVSKGKQRKTLLEQL